jgi:spermidine synthase
MLRLRLVPAMIGFSAVVAQVVLMRELLVVLGGAEISLGLALAAWLAWTAAGSGAIGRVTPSHPRFLLVVLCVLTAGVLPATIVGARLAKAALQLSPGELAGPCAALLAAVAGLGPFCLLSGWLFAAGSRWYMSETGRHTAEATGRMYLLESAGAAVGGLAASLILLRHLDPMQIALVISLLNLATGGLLLQGWRVAAAVLTLAVAIPPLAASLERSSLARLWSPFGVVEVRHSVYGNLLLAGHDGAQTLYENGLPVFSVDDVSAAEQCVHFGLLEHPAPTAVLLIGGGLNGSIREILKHPSVKRVDYVELDPEILQLAATRFPLPDDERLRTHAVDGRLFLKTSSAEFDVILVNLPDPQTAQLNRYFTVEFFREAAQRLSPVGILSFGLASSENYISPERAEFFRCINKTLRAVFPDVRFLPGSTLRVLACNSSGMLTTDANELVSRLRQRGVSTRYVSRALLPFELTPGRVAELAERLEPLSSTPVNRDFSPTAYYFGAVLWGTRFDLGASRWFSRLASLNFEPWLTATVIAALLACSLLIWRGPSAAAAASVAAAGFTSMGMEILLLLGFQAAFGYVYQQLAILIAAFMAGIGLGCWLALRGPALMSRLALLQLVLAGAPIALYLTLETLASSRAAIAFPLLALPCGVLGGLVFPIASRIYFDGRIHQGPGVLYAVDLMGSCVGALLISGFLLPLLGFLRAGLLMGVVCLAVALAGLVHALREPAR